MTDIRSLTLACTVLACVALLLLHALMARLWLARHPDVSPQKATALLGVAMNGPLILSVLSCGLWQKNSPTELLLAFIYAALAFNSVAYSYFHFFNLSETGRRIHMLLQLLEGERLAVQHGDSDGTTYSGHVMVSQRLVRLGQMGQLEQTEGRYRISGRFLLRVAMLVRFVGRLTTGRAV